MGVILAAGLVSSCSSTSGAPSGPHGNADPGGKRLAEIAKVAREAVPANALSTRLQLKRSTWGHGGCDGGPPGWTNMEVDQRFRAPGPVIAEIGAKMRRLHWHVVPRVNRRHAGQGLVPLSPGRNAPYVREYASSSAPGRPVAWLYTPEQTGRSFWELDLEASPAELPDHAC